MKNPFYAIPFLFLFNINCERKVEYRFINNDLSSQDLAYVPYHLNDVIALKEQTTGDTVSFICNYLKLDSTVGFSGCGHYDELCVRIKDEYFIIRLQTPTSDSIFNMQMNITPQGFEFEQNHIGSDLRGHDSPYNYNNNNISNISNTSDGQMIIDSMISNGKIFKGINCYYGKRYQTGPFDSLYFSSTNGIIRLILGTEGKILVQ